MGVYQRASDGRWVAALSRGSRTARVVTQRYAATRAEAEELLAQLIDPWEYVDRTGDCWLWMRRRTSLGYGLSWTGTRWQMAHRMIYEREVGPIPVGLYLCHRCDNPPCVRPDHMFPGSQSDNMQDMLRKGRWRRSSKAAGNAGTVSVAVNALAEAAL